ncbi:MAG TPA: hypothetical protein V6C91_00155 [Coleofasciculaceae cyanobacterium]
MTKKLINVTLSLVTSEIETILTHYPKYHQEAFANSDLRLSLIAYVLSRIPNTYTVLEENQISSTDSMLTYYSSQRILDIERFIHLGILDILHIDGPISDPLLHRDKFPFVFSDCFLN